MIPNAAEIARPRVTAATVVRLIVLAPFLITLAPRLAVAFIPARKKLAGREA